MTWLNAQYTINDAVARGQPVWDLLITNWGYFGNGLVIPEPDSIYFPKGPKPGPAGVGLPTPSAIAIGARSDIDRTLVLWNTQKIVPFEFIWDYMHRLCVGAPLLFPQMANELLCDDGFSADNAGSVQIQCAVQSPLVGQQRPGVRDGVIYKNEYRDVNNIGKVFGPTATITRNGVPATLPAFWLPPLLHLVFYLQEPPAEAPTKRFPLSMNEVLDAGSVAAGEQMIATIPIMGRKTVTFYLASNQICNFRVSTLRATNEQYPPREFTQFTAAAVPLGTQVGTTLTNLNADFLLINAAPTAVNNPKVNLALTASDGI